jgi:nitrilase
VEAATQKICSLIAEAGANGAKLIAFPELWIPGYPNYLYAHLENVIMDYTLKYYHNAVDVTSEHMERIRLAARAAEIMVVLGIAERGRGSLFMAQTFIGPDGGILLHRRKFKPTGFERVLFGDAVRINSLAPSKRRASVHHLTQSGDCATNVAATPIGRVGGLQCFEHLQPLLKYNTYNQGEQIHVAAWPNLFPPVGKMPFFNTVEPCTWASHMLAVECGTFVLLASSIQTEKGLRAHGFIIDGAEELLHTAVLGGDFSEIIAPDGGTLVEAPSPSFDGIIYGELDFNEIYYAKGIVDPVGHYSRPEIFTLHVNNTVNTHVAFAEKTDFAHASRFPELKEQ